jgi:GNAT superfamily N-acetyltransferase
MAFSLRLATLEDRPAIEELIGNSVRGLSRGDYSHAQIEAALGTVWGVDSQLIVDGTYFVAGAPDGTIVGAGGWSFRATRFGADAGPDRRPEILNPGREPARVRAFFVRPDRARQGIGRALLVRCEHEAANSGFKSAELVATLPGERLYRAFGYVSVEPVKHPLGAGLSIDFIAMRKGL